MKEHQMYPNNPNSAESILTEKLKDVSYGWVDNQRAIVLEAMEQYAKSERNKAIDELISRLDRGYKDYAWYKYLRLEIESLKVDL